MQQGLRTPPRCFPRVSRTEAVMRSFSKLVLPLVSLTLFAACAEQAPPRS